MNKLVLVFAVSLYAIGAVAQSGKLKKADSYYERVAYAEAADIYIELIGSEVDSPALKAKLADCYYQMGDSQRAEEYYSLMVTTVEAKEVDVYNYAQALKENGKYAESDTWMTKFHTMKSDDLRGKIFVENKSYIEQIEAQGTYFSLKHLSVNTPSADFGGYPDANGNAVFVSNRTKRIPVRRTHTWNGNRFLDLYTAKIGTNNELENPTFKSRKVNKKFHEGPLCFSPDNKRVYFTRNNMSTGKQRRDGEGVQNLKLYMATIAEDGEWIDERELPINSKEYSVGHPSLSADGKTMYFSSDMPGGFGGADIYKMSVNEDGSFGKPENLGAKINTEGQEMFPWMSKEGLLFFSSDGQLGLGGLDVFVMIPKKDGSFNKLMNVGKPINGPKDDFALIMNSDNLTGYVSSNRASGTGDDDIYSFELLKPLSVNLSLKGVITEKRSNNLLPAAVVNLVDQNGTIVASTISDEKGNYEFGLEPDLDYTVTVQKDDYFDNQGTVTTKNLADGTELIEKDLTLEKDPGLALYALVTDAKTNRPLEGVEMIITDNFTGEQFGTTITELSGDFLKGIADKKIDDRISYNIQLLKEGYFPKTVTFNHKIIEPGIINVHELLEGGLTLDASVTDLSQLVQINPINFDLNKYNIRPDAAIELDKIVVIMNKYPNMEVELGSHTDCRASKAYNEKLSDRRAKASAAYIKERITNPERIYGKGYGESRLINGCECEGTVKSDCSEEEHEKNRRTEFKVISTGDDKVKVNNSSTDSFDRP